MSEMLSFRHLPPWLRFNYHRLLFVLLLIGLFSSSLLGSYFFFSREKETSSQVSENQEEARDLPQGSAFDLSPIPLPEDPTSYAVLFVGHGGEGHAGGALADAMIVLVIYPTKKQAALISVPRDLWVKLPSYEATNKEVKLNYAFSTGGGKLAKESVSAVVGLPIQYFMSVDFGSFREAVDRLGSITVKVPVTFDDYWYPVAGLENESCGKSPQEILEIANNYSGFEGEKQFPCRYEHIHFDQGEMVMDGEIALKFVRSRHSEQHGGDFARSERQFAVLLGIKDKLLTLGAYEHKKAFFQQFKNMVQTDIDEGIVEMLSQVIGEIREYSLVRIQLTEANVLTVSRSYDGQSILVPRSESGTWDEVHSFIQAELAKVE